MAVAELVLPGRRFRIRSIPLLMSCETFENDPSLLSQPYEVRSTVSPDLFRAFLDAILGGVPEITRSNVINFGLLSKEFGFALLSQAVRDFQSRHSEFDASVSREWTSLEEDNSRRRDELVMIRSELLSVRDELASTKDRNQSLAESNRRLERSEVELDREIAQAVKKLVPFGMRTVSRACAVGSPTTGIIAYLVSLSGGNVHDRRVVQVTSSSTASPDHLPKFAADVTNTDTSFISGRGILNWLCYDFIDRRILPTHYALTPGPGGLHSWLIEVSGDGRHWLKIHDVSGAGSTQIAATYTIAIEQPCRCIRIVQKGVPTGGNAVLAVASWEIFGTVIQRE
jgi:hypothetical protein